MRNLTAEQKKILGNYITSQLAGQFSQTKFTENRTFLVEVPEQIIEKLETINDYETLWQDAERYVSDESSKIAFSKK